MILKSFKYFSDRWTLDSLILGKTNLIVGKNSSGKSRALRALDRITSLISQRIPIEYENNLSADIILADTNNDEIYFSLKIVGKKVVKEVLKLNDKVIIDRNDDDAKISNETVNPPAEKLLIHVRRDVEKYPEFEKVIKWSEESIILSFINQGIPNHDDLYELVSKFTPEMKQHLIKMANKVGFPLTEFDTFESIINKLAIPNKDFDKVKLILLQEKNVDTILTLDDLSSGMHRTILLLVLIEQLINLGHPALLAIDDLGEGLDYSRATQVGKLLVNVCRKHGVQLIATSNEEFMMNIVDIDEWNVLVRNGGTVKSITSSTCPEEFEDFKFSGLSNFDFFTSDFLSRIASKLFDEEK